MQKYLTRQRKELLNYLREHTDELLSIQQIANDLKEASVSLSSVYRNLYALEAEGKVRRGNRGGSREVCYQYIDTDACRECLHLCCKRCGKTFHMDTMAADKLMKTLDNLEGFALDKKETILYGLCSTCRKQDAEAAAKAATEVVTEAAVSES